MGGGEEARVGSRADRLRPQSLCHQVQPRGATVAGRGKSTRTAVGCITVEAEVAQWGRMCGMGPWRDAAGSGLASCHCTAECRLPGSLLRQKDHTAAFLAPTAN